MMKKIISIILRYKTIIICLVILGFFGYTLWRVQVISNPAANQVYLEKKRKELPAGNKIQVKDAVRVQIEQLQETPVNTEPGQLGTSDPFNP